MYALQKHTALPQRKITLIQKGLFVLNTAFVGRYGDVVIILSHLAYSAEIVLWESGHEEEVHEAEEVRIWTVNLSR